MNDFENIFEALKGQQLNIALEALNDIYARLPFGTEIVFSDGRKGTITKFVTPRLDKEGWPEAGFDIKMEDSHLEFWITLSGWGSGIPKHLQVPIEAIP